MVTAVMVRNGRRNLSALTVRENCALMAGARSAGNGDCARWRRRVAQNDHSLEPPRLRRRVHGYVGSRWRTALLLPLAG